jgi:two-component system OmpR family sensor kinase
MVHRLELLQQVAHSAAAEARRATAEELVTVLAHDLRNYLTPLQGWLGLLTRRATKDQRQADLVDLAGIATTMHRLERLITDLMDTARLSQGLFTLTKQPIDLTGLVEEVALMHSTPFVQIDVQMPEEQVAWVDADRLRQALENVLSNAVQALAASVPYASRINWRKSSGWANIKRSPCMLKLYKIWLTPVP